MAALRLMLIITGGNACILGLYGWVAGLAFVATRSRFRADRFTEDDLARFLRDAGRLIQIWSGTICVLWPFIESSWGL